MRRLERLQRVNKFLKGFSVDGVSPVRVVSQADATGKLARLGGRQVLVARPELHQSGNSDGFRDSVSLAFFVLAKDLGAGATQEKEDALFGELEALASDILDMVAADTAYCGLLSGLSLVSADVVPENTIFGGWVGYSVDIVLE